MSRNADISRCTGDNGRPETHYDTMIDTAAAAGAAGAIQRDCTARRLAHARIDHADAGSVATRHSIPANADVAGA